MDKCLKGFLLFVSFRPTLFLGSSSGAMVRRYRNPPDQVDDVVLCSSGSQAVGRVAQVTRDKPFTCHIGIHGSSVEGLHLRDNSCFVIFEIRDN